MRFEISPLFSFQWTFQISKGVCNRWVSYDAYWPVKYSHLGQMANQLGSADIFENLFTGTAPYNNGINR